MKHRAVIGKCPLPRFLDLSFNILAATLRLRSAHTPILQADQYRHHETQPMENVFLDHLRYVHSTSAFP